MRGVSSPRMLRGGTGERTRGDGRVPFTVHRALGSERARLLAAGGRRCRSPRRHRCPTPKVRVAVRNLSATRSAAASAWRHGPRPSVPWRPKLRARNLHARTPSRQYRTAGAVRVTNRTRGSMFSARRLLGPRLHREEGDGFIIGTPRPEIKWGFRRSDPGGLTAPCRPQPVKTPRAAGSARPGTAGGTARTAPRSPRTRASSPRCRRRPR